MKENKYGIMVSILLFIVSLLGSIFFKIAWWQNFSFAVLGGTICSLILFIINHALSMKKCAEDIVVGIYKINTFGFSNLFSQNKSLTLKQAMNVLNILDEKTYEVYIKNHELLKGTFVLDRRRKLLNEIELAIDRFIGKIYDIESYIEVYTQEASTKSRFLYKKLDEMIDSNSLYLKAIKMAKSFKSNINSLEETEKKFKIKKFCADRFRSSMK